MTDKNKISLSNQAFLPMEYLPRIPHPADEKHARHYLIPGNLFVAAEPFAISTILGSGVALCLWDRERGIGGANHVMLPEGPKDAENAVRYANFANPALLQKLLALGADAKSLEAKIFGGSLPNVKFGGEKTHVGELNVQAVTGFLRESGIRVAHSEVGGTRGRKLIFHTDTGRFWSEQI